MQTYHGSCHCGAVAYHVTADLSSVLSCNCSHCARKGFLLTFVPADNFVLEQGESALTEYRFNKKHIAHLFCNICGVQCFGRGTGPDGSDTIAVNIRTIPDLDYTNIAITEFDGKAL